MEDRKVEISRLKTKVVYPASFTLVAASNPCPCGFYGEGDRCSCSPGRREAYFSKLSGPIMDRIDIQLWIHGVDPALIVNRRATERSETIAERVVAARNIQRERFRDEGIFTNAEMNNRLIDIHCSLDRDCRDFLEKAMERFSMSARACTRILKIARTIADLDGCDSIGLPHLSEALGYRILDRAMR